MVVKGNINIMIESYGKDVKTELGANFYDTVPKAGIGVEVIERKVLVLRFTLDATGACLYRRTCGRGNGRETLQAWLRLPETYTPRQTFKLLIMRRNGICQY